MPLSKSSSNPTTAVLFLILIHAAEAATENPDLRPLLLFKSAADPDGAALASWNASSDPCTATWHGVTCLRGRVSRLVVENLRLGGGFPLPLASLTQLRVLSLKENGFSGRIPDLSNLTSLKLLFLSHNRFSGDFPSSVASLPRLYRLDLSFNNFSGAVPLAVNGLSHLLTLKLEENGFSGQIPRLELPNLQEFNVSGNRFTGEIPNSLSIFPTSSFRNNRALCGPPLGKCGDISSDPARPARTTSSSSPARMPTGTQPPIISRNNHRGKFSSVAIIAIIIGDALVLGLVSLLLYCYFWRNYSQNEEDDSRKRTLAKTAGPTSPYPAQSGQERGPIVFFEGARWFELEDLLRASAEMLGRGGLGTAYKAVLDDGGVVAVKRLKDLGVHSRKEFESQMEILGRLKHPNLVELKAYYFAIDEKLLVYEFMPNGSLFWLLHGNRGPGRTPLEWKRRLKIAASTAQGLAFIHFSCKSLKLVHGNVKSTNVLIDRNGDARVSDFGLSALASPSSLPRDGYRAPEAAALGRRRLTQKGDVYAFGVLLLELLTGKFPSAAEGGLVRWVESVVREEWTAEVFDIELMRYKDIEEEMVGLLQIGLACAQASPENRPRMSVVVKMIDELRGVEASPSPAADSPAVSDEV